MSYQLPPDIEQLVNAHVGQGGYSSADEVLRDALRALEEISYFRSDSTTGRILTFDELKREIGRGLEQLDRGESHDSEEVFGDILRDLPTVD